jgi:hypothetical protein
MAGEFVVIVLGVLVALAADAWNDSRLERKEEALYLQRLHTSIVSDTLYYRFVLDWMDRKEMALERLDVLLTSPDTGFHPDTVLADWAAAPNFGWNVGPLASEATFEDLRSSGKLGVIQDPGLRSQVIEYYESAAGEDRRIEARRTAFPTVAYRLIPFDRAESASEFATASDVSALLGKIRESELPGYILAETNRANFIRGSITRIQGLAAELLDALVLGSEG